MNTFIIIRNIALNADERWSEMAELKKVTKGLQRCISDPNEFGDCNSAECPYKGVNCFTDLMEDALELLKAQEPRVMTLEEATGDGECWFEHKNGACGYADCYMCTGVQAAEIDRIMKAPEYLTLKTYSKTWRCWTSRPTDEQREKVKWDD